MIAIVTIPLIITPTNDTEIVRNKHGIEFLSPKQNTRRPRYCIQSTPRHSSPSLSLLMNKKYKNKPPHMHVCPQSESGNMWTTTFVRNKTFDDFWRTNFVFRRVLLSEMNLFRICNAIRSPIRLAGGMLLDYEDECSRADYKRENTSFIRRVSLGIQLGMRNQREWKIISIRHSLLYSPVYLPRAAVA